MGLRSDENNNNFCCKSFRVLKSDFTSGENYLMYRLPESKMTLAMKALF